MVKKIFSIFLLLILFAVSFVAFFPKERLYFYGQKKLQVYGIDITAKRCDSHPFSLDLHKLVINYSGASVLRLEQATITPFSLILENVRGMGLLGEIVPPLLHVDAYTKSGKFLVMSSSYGTAEGMFDWKEKKILLRIMPTAQGIRKYAKSLRQCKKVGGDYVYEYHL